ncbi:MAG: hypothetical protein ACP5XB_19720, partial [Isosphaeraceae bacterium]
GGSTRKPAEKRCLKAGRSLCEGGLTGRGFKEGFRVEHAKTPAFTKAGMLGLLDRRRKAALQAIADKRADLLQVLERAEAPSIKAVSTYPSDANSGALTSYRRVGEARPRG